MADNAVCVVEAPKLAATGHTPTTVQLDFAITVVPVGVSGNAANADLSINVGGAATTATIRTAVGAAIINWATLTNRPGDTRDFNIVRILFPDFTLVTPT